MTSTDPVTQLAALIRKVDGNHQMGAGNLAEALIEAGVRVPDPAEQAANQRFAAHQGERVSQNLKAQAKRLREVADELSRLAGKALELALDGPTRTNESYAAIAQDAQQVILQRVAGNTDLSSLITVAAEADEWRIRAELAAAPKEG